MVPGVKGDLKQEIFNEVSENVKALEKLFPSAVKDGQVDFQALKEELGQFEEVGPEKYGLTWSGKQNAKKNAQQDLIGKTLKYIPEDSKNPETTDNLYIEGDNLEVLKLLRQNYYGAIKMIYIDPPYNTGNDFVYNDNFNMDKTESDIAEGDVSELGERYKINAKSTNRYHANWLNMMYPRLKVAKDLLSDDGVIFISIDDDELDNLRKICDEIFGSDNFITQISWYKSYGKNESNFYSNNIEYFLVYAKLPEVILEKKLHFLTIKNGYYEVSKLLSDLKDKNIKIKNAETQIKLLCKNKGYKGISGYCNLDEKYRLWQAVSIEKPKDPCYFYNVIHPITGKACKIPKNGWRMPEGTMKELINKNLIVFGDTEKTTPRRKYFLEDVKYETPKNFIENSKQGGKEIKELFEGKSVFDYPKHSTVMCELLKIYRGDTAYVLDFFSGSSTTAHAVMQLNAEDGGNRKFIMVQIPEKTDEKSEARKAGYKNICEIGRARIDKAGDKIKEENKDKEGIEDLDIGFKVFRVSDTNIRWEYESENLKTLASEYTSTPIIEQTTFNEIAATGNLQIGFDEVVSPKDRLDFMPGAKDIDVVYEILLRQRDIPLSAKVELLSDIGARTYLFADSFLVCLEEDITKELIEKLAAINPLPIKFILRDSAFGDDIALKDETYRRLTALIERNSGESKKAYTVEFI